MCRNAGDEEEGTEEVGGEEHGASARDAFSL